MGFTLPKFVNNLDVWALPNTPAANAPTGTNQPCQVYTNSRVPVFWFDSTTGKYAPIILIRFPDQPSQDVQPGWIIGKDLPAPNNDTLFRSLFRMRMHTGFPNVYKQHYCVRCSRTGAVVFQPLP